MSSFPSANGTVRTRPPLLGLLPAARESRRIRMSVSWPAALACTAVALLGAWIVIRGCDYQIRLPLAYGVYFGLHVVLPGVIALALLREPMRPFPRALALAIPTGFAVDIAAFLACRAGNATGLVPFLPIAWTLLGLAVFKRGQVSPRRSPPARIGAIAVCLCTLALLTVVAAAGHLYAESPLVAGLPQRPLFHDWVYLLSRAAAIKGRWPLEDPSLAGTPLQYHYFLLVHAAAASAATGIDLSWILLRLAPIPLGIVLVAQAYVLGSTLSRSRWIGVLAAFLWLVPGELSRASDYGHLMYLGFFLRWLYVSPTFLFGLVFFGALTITATEDAELNRWQRIALMAILAAAATAAKGPVVPVVVAALTLYAAYRTAAERRLPRDVIVTTATIGGAFVIVYAITLAGCGTGEAQVQPFRLCEITEFWQRHAVLWQRMLKRSLHAPLLGTWLGKSAVAACILAGTAGIKVVALPYICAIRDCARRPLAIWLGCLVAASTAWALTLHLDGDSELYFLFLAPLPLAVLAAAACGHGVAWASVQFTQELRGSRKWAGASIATIMALTAATVLSLQLATTVRCEAAGVNDWANLRPDLRVNDDLKPLYELTGWVRRNTEPDAVLIANAFTSVTVGRNRGVEVDHTTVGVNYVLSALAERRLWVEGPAYLMDSAEARLRLVAATRYFRDGTPLPGRLPHDSPMYVIVDHTVGDAHLPASDRRRVYANGRFDVFRAAAGAGVSRGGR